MTFKANEICFILSLKETSQRNPLAWSSKSSTNTWFTLVYQMTTAALDHNDTPYIACYFCDTRQQNLAKAKLAALQDKAPLRCPLLISLSLKAAPQIRPPVAACDPYCSHHTHTQESCSSLSEKPKCARSHSRSSCSNKYLQGVHFRRTKSLH